MKYTALSQEQEAINAEFAQYDFEPLPIKNMEPHQIKRAVKTAVGEQLFKMVEAIVAFGSEQAEILIKEKSLVCLADIGHGMSASVAIHRNALHTFSIGNNVFVFHHNIYREGYPKRQARENRAEIAIGKNYVFSAYWRKNGINTHFTIGSTFEAKKAFRIVQEKFNEISALSIIAKDQQ